MGRHSTYDPDRHLPFVRLLAEKGCTDMEIYGALGIAETTFYEWRNKYPEIEGTLKDARVKPLAEVEAALFKKAVGYMTTEKHYRTMPDGTLQLVKTVEKELSPDTTALIFWLINRSDRWKDTRSVAAELNVPQLADFVESIQLTDEERQKANLAAYGYSEDAIEEMAADVGGNGNSGK
jgi:hypothetical protein